VVLLFFTLFALLLMHIAYSRISGRLRLQHHPLDLNNKLVNRDSRQIENAKWTKDGTKRI
jgi:hypothetical protein